MAFRLVSSYIENLLWLVILFLVYHALAFTRRQWALQRSNRQKAQARDCQAALQKRSWAWGLDLIFWRYRCFNEHTVLSCGQQEFTNLGVRTFQFNVLGQNTFTTVEPDNIQSMMATDFNSWAMGVTRQPFAALLGEGIFSADGAAWRHSRDLIRPSFGRAEIADTEFLERHVLNLVNAIARAGPEVDLAPLFFNSSMDISTEFLFGQSTASLAAETLPAQTVRFLSSWNRCLNKIGGGSGKLGLLGGIITKNPQFVRDRQVVHDFVNGYIEETISKQQPDEIDTECKKRYILLKELIRKNLPAKVVRHEVLNALLAGRETTAALLSNLFFLLSRRPDIEERLRAEIANLQDLSIDATTRLPYLKAFINESMRLYPIVPQQARQAVQDTTLPLGGGVDEKSPVFIAKGSLCGWNLYAMHRRKDLFGEDAEELKPERWLDTHNGKGIQPGWAYLPFSGGPRVCIGQQFALGTASYILVRLLQEFSLAQNDPREHWQENLYIACSIFPGCKVSLTRKR